ncbi:MAG: citrate synthase [Polyangiaceae bacterium]|nr:citrate synthase [Polyangiaceae bacterium]
MGTIAEGLEGVVVTSTKLSDVDGEAGRLIIGGYDVEALTGRVSFEATCHLLWRGSLPSQAEEHALRRALGEARAAAFATLSSRRELLAMNDAMDALRALVAGIALPSGRWPDEAVALTGATAVFVAAYARHRSGAALVEPDATRGHAEDYLRMAGVDPHPARVAGLDAYLSTVTDHGMNASTFAARVVASTGSDIVSSITAAIGALKGPLHGGAPGPVLDMLDAIGEPGQATAWLETELATGRRIMGMGHRVYRVRDPRAAVLERALGVLEADLGADRGGSARLALARAVEAAATKTLARKYPNRSLQANVEFYTAVLLDAVGLPRWLFSATFAVGRVAGWCAHVEEQRSRGRLIRPASVYDGPRFTSAS